CHNTRARSALRYDDHLLRLAGLDRDKLPDLVPTASVLGPLAPEAAAALGLPPTVQVVTGAPDILASAIGAGTVADLDAHLYLGTSSWLVCHVPYRKSDLFHKLASTPSAGNRAGVGRGGPGRAGPAPVPIGRGPVPGHAGPGRRGPARQRRAALHPVA